MKMNNLEEIMKMGKAVELMTPGGFVHLSAEQVKNISNIKEINANAGCRGYNMPLMSMNYYPLKLSGAVIILKRIRMNF